MRATLAVMAAIGRFAERCREFGETGIQVLANPTEEIVRDLQRGKGVRLFQAGAGKPPTRLEENYLYSSRAFTEGAGNFVAGDYRFFQNAVGQAGAADGFSAAGMILTDLETNMDVGGQIAQGKNFVFKQVGISFGAEALQEDVAQLMDAGALRYSKQGDQFTLKHGPARLWPGGTGVSSYAGAAAAVGSNGTPDVRAVRQLKVARVIREKESFAYIYSVPRSVRQVGPGAPNVPVAWELTNSTVMTVWLWGGQFDTIPG